MLTLCIVDMQEAFGAALNAITIRACLKEIKLAINRKAPIVFLEWDGCGPTLKDLLDAVKNYELGQRTIKYADDGSAATINLLRNMQLDPDSLDYRICGVNTDYCVASTVKGLRKRLKKSRIEVAWPACNTEWSKAHALRRLHGVSGVRILGCPKKV